MLGRPVSPRPQRRRPLRQTGGGAGRGLPGRRRRRRVVRAAGRVGRRRPPPPVGPAGQDSFAWACGRRTVWLWRWRTGSAACRFGRRSRPAPGRGRSSRRPPSLTPLALIPLAARPFHVRPRRRGLDAANQAARGGGATTLVLGAGERDGQSLWPESATAPPSWSSGGGSILAGAVCRPRRRWRRHRDRRPARPARSRRWRVRRSDPETVLVLVTDGSGGPVAGRTDDGGAGSGRRRRRPTRVHWSWPSWPTSRARAATTTGQSLPVWLLGPTPEPGTAAPSSPDPPVASKTWRTRS